MLGLFHGIRFFPPRFFFSLSPFCTYLPTISGSADSLSILEKLRIHDNSTRVSCDYDKVVMSLTVMLKPIELSLFYPTAKNLTPIFKILILGFAEVIQYLLLAASSCESTLLFCSHNNLFF